MKKILLVFIFLPCYFMACNKQNDNVLPPTTTTPDQTRPPDPTKGSITGTVIPVKAVDSVAATNLQTNKVYSIKLDTTQYGFFKMADLIPGSYTVSFIAAKAMIAPKKVNVTVTDGQNSDIGIVQSNSSISGIVSPVNAVTGITATNSQTNVSNTLALDTVSGIFKIADLSPGTYIVRFIAAKSILSPNKITITILSGQNFDMGIITYGSLSGIVIPAKTAATISAVNVQTSVSYIAALDTISGIFKISGMLAGMYTLYFTASTGELLMSIPVTIANIQDLDVGNIIFKIGSLHGTIAPLGSASSIVAKNLATNISYSAYPSSSGIFKFLQLQEGTYSVSAKGASGFEALGFSIINVVANKDVDMGNITLAPYSDPAIENFIFYNMNGTNYWRGQNVTNTYSSPIFRINSAKTQNQPDIFGQIKSLLVEGFYIMLDDVNGPGTYVCKGTLASNIKYLSQASFSATQKSWSTVNAGGSGTVIITSVDPVARTVSGTFTALLVPDNVNSIGTMAITSGTFSKIKY